MSLISSPHRALDDITVDNKSNDNIDINFEWKHLSLLNTRCRKEAKQIMSLGTPIAFSVATQFCQSFTNQAVVGHLGTDYLAAACLADVVMSISGSYIFAFCSTINVLSSQAYGAKNYKLVSEWYQLGCLMALFLSIPPTIIYLYTEQILHHLFAANQHIAELSGIFAKWSILSIIPQTQYVALQMYFESQSNVIPIMIISSLMIIFNLVINLILVYGYIIHWIYPNWNGLGFIGSPISTAITSIVSYLIYVIYMFWYKKHHLSTWSTVKCSTFSMQRINKFMAVAIPQTIQQALEDWQLEVVTLFTSRLDQVAVAAFTSLGTIIILFHCFAIGIGGAIQVKVGNALGANKPNYAKYISWISIIIALISGAIIGGILGVFGQYLSHIISGTNEMYQMYKEVCPMVGITYFVFNLLTIICGILVGQARTIGLAILSLIGCWCVSVPLSYVLGIYFNIGIKGIFLGLIVGYTIFMIGVVILFIMSDWNKCAMDAVKRSKESENDKEILLIN